MSPSNEVDHSWVPVKHYIEKVMKVKDTKEEPIYLHSTQASGVHEEAGPQDDIPDTHCY